MTIKQRIEARKARERRICTGSRVGEWILCAAALWAGLVMAWTPTILRQNPPPFYRIVNSYFDAWIIGLAIGIVPVVHGIGLLLSSCQCAPGIKSDDEENCGCGELSQKVGAHLRRACALGQCGIWGFLTTIYALLWFQQREITFGSGVCVIFEVCASLCSYCISKEHSRSQVREEVSQMISQNEGKSRGEVLERLKEMT